MIHIHSSPRYPLWCPALGSHQGSRFAFCWRVSEPHFNPLQYCSPGSLTETLPACLLFTSASFWPSRPAFCQRGPLSSVSRKPAGLPSGTVVKNLPATQEMPDMRLSPWVGKIPYEKGMATHSSTLAWVIPWTEELGRLQSMGSQRIKHD